MKDKDAWQQINQDLFFKYDEPEPLHLDEPVGAKVQHKVSEDTVFAVRDAGVDPDEFLDLLD